MEMTVVSGGGVTKKGAVSKHTCKTGEGEDR